MLSIHIKIAADDDKQQGGKAVTVAEKGEKKTFINTIDFYPFGFSLCMNCNFRAYFGN